MHTPNVLRKPVPLVPKAKLPGSGAASPINSPGLARDHSPTFERGDVGLKSQF